MFFIEYFPHDDVEYYKDDITLEIRCFCNEFSCNRKQTENLTFQTRAN